MTSIRCRTTDSPVGPLTIAGDHDGVTHLRMEDQAHPPNDREEWRPDPTAFPAVVEQLQAYFAGELTTFELSLRPHGTAFQRRVWQALLEIPYGETRSYGQIAKRLGQPGAARAVGLANGRNPIGIIIPCHRVIGANGALTGYGGGIARKRALLQLERERSAPALELSTS